MNKITIVILGSIIIFCSVGCSTQQKNLNQDNNYEITSDDSSVLNNDTSAITSSTNENKINKDSVIDFITKYVNTETEEKYNFWVTDLNDDGIKELFIGAKDYAVMYQDGEANPVTNIYLRYENQILKIQRFHDSITNQNFCIYDDINNQEKVKYTSICAFDDEFSYYLSNSQTKPVFLIEENKDYINYYLSNPIVQRYNITDIERYGGDDAKVKYEVYNSAYNMFISDLEELPVNASYNNFSIQEIINMTDKEWQTLFN